jgi:hypothetical protein
MPTQVTLLIAQLQRERNSAFVPSAVAARRAWDLLRPAETAVRTATPYAGGCAGWHPGLLGLLGRCLANEAVTRHWGPDCYF